MRHTLFALILFVSALSAPVAYAQEGAPPDAVEVSDEAKVEAEEAAAENQPAIEASDEASDEAPTEGEAPSEEDLEATADSTSMLVQALQNKQWGLAIGMMLCLLVAFANKFGMKDKVGSKAVPWVTSGIAVAGAIGAALMSGVAVTEALTQGLVAGMTAIGGWEMVLKHIFKKNESASS